MGLGGGGGRCNDNGSVYFSMKCNLTKMSKDFCLRILMPVYDVCVCFEEVVILLFPP